MSSQDADEVVEEKASTQGGVKAFISGGVGGICAVLTGHPFDLTKVRMQTAKQGTYTGAMDVVKKTIARDGARGLYRGVLPPLVGVTPIFALSFWSYDLGKKLVYKAREYTGSTKTAPALSMPELAAAGFFSAVPTTLVCAPMERVKVMMQVQGQEAGAKNAGVVEIVQKMYRQGGLKSVFRGTGATLARDGPGSSVYFLTYEACKKALSKETASGTPELNFGSVLLAGGMAGMAMWSVAIPPDVIKSRLQSAEEGVYKGFMDCARQMVAKEGIGSVFKGFGPAMARAFPANAATFVGVEFALSVMNKMF